MDLLCPCQQFGIHRETWPHGLPRWYWWTPWAIDKKIYPLVIWHSYMYILYIYRKSPCFRRCSIANHVENYQRVYPNPPKFSGWSSFPCWNVHFLDKARSPPLAIGFWPKYSWVTYPICKWLQRMAMKIANVWVKHCYIVEDLPQVHFFRAK